MVAGACLVPLFATGLDSGDGAARQYSLSGFTGLAEGAWASWLCSRFTGLAEGTWASWLYMSATCLYWISAASTPSTNVISTSLWIDPLWKSSPGHGGSIFDLFTSVPASFVGLIAEVSA